MQKTCTHVLLKFHMTCLFCFGVVFLAINLNMNSDSRISQTVDLKTHFQMLCDNAVPATTSTRVILFIFFFPPTESQNFTCVTPPCLTLLQKWQPACRHCSDSKIPNLSSPGKHEAASQDGKCDLPAGLAIQEKPP